MTPLRRRLLDATGRRSLLRLCIDAYADGATLEQVHTRLAGPSRLGEWAGAHPGQVEALWRVAMNHVGDHRRSLDTRLARFHDARLQTFSGITGGTDLAVLDAFGRLCVRYCRLPLAMPLKALAAEANVTVNTARRSLARLLADGWLVRTAPATPTRAAEYDLGPIVELMVPATVAHDVELSHDAGKIPWIGPHALRLWSQLDDVPRLPSELATRFGYNANSVRRRLRRLGDAGLATRTPAGWRRGPATLEDVAADHGTAGLREQRRARLRAEQLTRSRAGGR